MGIDILLTITRFVSVALIVYGVYEIVMFFRTQQSEKKIKGMIAFNISLGIVLIVAPILTCLL